MSKLKRRLILVSLALYTLAAFETVAYVKTYEDTFDWSKSKHEFVDANLFIISMTGVAAICTILAIASGDLEL